MKFFSKKREPSKTGESGLGLSPLGEQVNGYLQKGEALAGLKFLESQDKSRFPSEYHYWLANCLSELGRHAEALQEVDKQLATHPNSESARQLKERLVKGLILPRTGSNQMDERDWHTSIPREFLLRIQRSLHTFAYKGVPMLKNPFDLALYSRLIWELKPRTILEIGSKSGGSAIWFADTLRNYAIDGRVFSVDIVKVNDVHDPLVTFIEGNGRSLEATWTPEFLDNLPRPVLVIEDADHSYETSIAVLNFFHSFLRQGEYIVIEDGIITDLSEDRSYFSGPHRALQEFWAAHKGEFIVDNTYCDFFGYNVTWATNGFLKRL